MLYITSLHIVCMTFCLRTELQDSPSCPAAWETTRLVGCGKPQNSSLMEFNKNKTLGTVVCVCIYIYSTLYIYIISINNYIYIYIQTIVPCTQCFLCVTHCKSPLFQVMFPVLLGCFIPARKYIFIQIFFMGYVGLVKCGWLGNPPPWFSWFVAGKIIKLAGFSSLGADYRVRSSTEIYQVITLSGWWYTYPLKNMLVSWDYHSQYMESHKSHVPNHQSVMIRRNHLYTLYTIYEGRPSHLDYWAVCYGKVVHSWLTYDDLPVLPIENSDFSTARLK